MEIKYWARADFYLDDIYLEVPDNATHEEILKLICEDLESRYRLDYGYTLPDDEEEREN